jgi:hypothetical protein
MNTFGEEWSRNNSTLTAIESTFTAHPEVWKDAEYRQMAIDIMLSSATNIILNGADEEICGTGQPIAVSAFILE